jgi:hypothetical protein
VLLAEAIWRRQLRAGRGHTQIETDLETASTRLNLLAALALTGDASRGGEVLPRLNGWGRRFADTYQVLNKGAHGAHRGDLGLLVGDARNSPARSLAASRDTGGAARRRQAPHRSMRSQILCLTAYLDQSTAARTAYLGPHSVAAATSTPTNWPPLPPN